MSRRPTQANDSDPAQPLALNTSVDKVCGAQHAELYLLGSCADTAQKLLLAASCANPLAVVHTFLLSGRCLDLSCTHAPVQQLPEFLV